MNINKYKIVTWNSNIAQNELKIKDKSYISLINSRSYLLNSQIFFKGRKYQWIIVHSPSVKIIKENLWFPKLYPTSRKFLFYSDGVDWQDHLINFDPSHFAYYIWRPMAIPFDPSLSDSQALFHHLQNIKKRYYKQIFKLKKPIWELYD